MFPINTRQFSLTFLNFPQNIHGYVDGIKSSDREATKRLLTPFLPPTNRIIGNVVDESPANVPECHRLGAKMWSFARECSAMKEPVVQPKDRDTGLRIPEDQSLKCSVDVPVDVSHSNITSEALESARRTEHQETDNVKVLLETLNNCSQMIRASTVKVRNANGTEQTGYSNVLGDQSVSDSGINDQTNSFPEFSRSDHYTDHNRTNELHQELSNEKPVTAENVLSLLTLDQPSDTEHVASNSGISFDSEENLCSLAHIELYPKFIEQDELPKECSATGSPTIDSSTNGNISEHVVHAANQKHKEWNASFEESVASSTGCRKNDGHNDINTQSLFGNKGILGEENFTEVLFEESCIRPLPLLKQTAQHNKKMPLSSKTLNFNLEALKSVLQPKRRNLVSTESSDVKICGKIAVLFGSDETTMEVLKSEVVGTYDYISGAVSRHDLQHNADKLQEIKAPLSAHDGYTDLAVFLAQLHHLFRASSSKGVAYNTILRHHTPVAWLLTSPALGVKLDWQVLIKIQDFCSDKSSRQMESTVSTQSKLLPRWQRLLVVVDEYRCVEKGIPLVEAYEICDGSIVKLVSFDLN